MRSTPSMPGIPCSPRHSKSSCSAPATSAAAGNLADATIKAHARKLERQLDRLLELESTNADGRHLRDAIIVDACDKLLVFLTRRDVEPTNNASERALRPSVIFRRVTNGFRSDWGAKVYADICPLSLPAASTAAVPSPLSAPLSRVGTSRLYPNHLGVQG
jgi:hypothetical protein